MEQWGKILLSSFAEFLCFVCVVTLPVCHFVSNGTRLGIDGYLLWLLAVVQSCYSFWECFTCCSVVCYSFMSVLIES